MNIAQLNERLCRDMVLGVHDQDGQSFISTRFTYPVGDSVNLYLVDHADGQKLSDLGTTNYILRTKGINPDTEERRRIIQSICELYDVDLDEEFSFTKRISQESAGLDALAFCEAITRISTLQYEQRARHYSGLEGELDTVLTGTVVETQLTKKWVDLDIDPDGCYPVDYHLNSVGEPRDIFVVSTRLRAETVAGTINFLRANERSHPTLSVVAPGLGLPRRTERKLEQVSVVRFGVDGNELEILDFATHR